MQASNPRRREKMAKRKYGDDNNQGYQEPQVDEPEAPVEEPVEVAKPKDEIGGVLVTHTKKPDLSGQYPTDPDTLERYKEMVADENTAEISLMADSAGVEREWPGEDA